MISQNAPCHLFHNNYSSSLQRRTCQSSTPLTIEKNQLSNISYLIWIFDVWSTQQPTIEKDANKKPLICLFIAVIAIVIRSMFFYVSEKSLTPMSSHEEPIVEKMPLWINGFLCPPSFCWLRTLWAQNSRKNNSVCAQSTVQPWYISYKCKTINSLL